MKNGNTVLHSEELSLQGGRLSLSVEYRRSNRASRMRLTLTPENKAILTLPMRGGSLSEAKLFLTTSIPWLERMLLRQMTQQQSGQDPQRGPVQSRNHSKRSYPERFIFPAFSQEYKILYRFRDACWCAVREEDESTLLVSGNVTDPALVREALGSYLIRKGEKLFEKPLRALSQECSIPYNKMTVRIQKGRWGSCSSKGNISLNGKMLFFPEEALRYVLIHELCHLRHMDHSVRFWAEVAQFCPDYKKIKMQIRKGFPSLWEP